jgi:hypothetical protein
MSATSHAASTTNFERRPETMRARVLTERTIQKFYESQTALT